MPRRPRRGEAARLQAAGLRGRAPKPLRAVIERALQMKPKNRYKSAGDLRAALAKAREEMG